MIDDNGNNLVFLLATPRAGSTLLSVILGNHSKVLCPSEPWFLLSLRALYNGYNGVVARYDQRFADIGLHELVAEEEFNSAARAFARTVYNTKLATAQKTVFVDKTPRYYHIIPFLEQLFPQSKRFWLKRNPLDVAASFVSSWGNSIDELTGTQLSPYSFDLTLGLHNLSEYFRQHKDGFELRYEDLVRNPAQTIEQLFSFLEIPSEGDLEDYGRNEAHMSMYGKSFLGDKKVLAHSRPHSDSIDRWINILSRSDVQKLLTCFGADIFERMGYSNTLDTLRAQGYHFPEQQAVEERLQRLQAQADAFSTAFGETLQTTEAVSFSSSGHSNSFAADQNAFVISQLLASEADRAARLETIQRLDAEARALQDRLAASETDRAARDELNAEVARLREQLAVSEADRAARLRVIERLDEQLRAAKTQRGLHVAIIQKLRQAYRHVVAIKRQG